jgi:NADPH-dependent glutamate synthase beta subunit-like oxidoreductase
VIFAIGQVVETSLLPNQIMIMNGTIVAHPTTLETALPGVFAGGDAVLGPSSVVEAIASGKKATISIDLYLRGQDLQMDRKKEVRKVEKTPKEGMELMARQVTPFIQAAERSKGFREIRLGLSEEMAMMEAERCMTCGSKAYIGYPEDCMTCYSCELRCPYEAIYVHPFKEVLPLAIQYRTR